jgi:hypothetical protein
MPNIYDSILKNIQRDIHSYAGKLQDPAAEFELQGLQVQSKNELGIHLPDEYIAFLSKNNGLDYNGTVFYASDRSLIAGYNDRYIEGVIFANLTARDVDDMKSFLIFGESDDLLHTLYLPEQKYRTIESIGNSVYAEYDSFDTMIAQVLNDLL